MTGLSFPICCLKLMPFKFSVKGEFSCLINFLSAPSLPSLLSCLSLESLASLSRLVSVLSLFVLSDESLLSF